MARVHRILDVDITGPGVQTLATPESLQQLYDQTGFAVVRAGTDILGAGTGGVPTDLTVQIMGSIHSAKPSAYGGAGNGFVLATLDETPATSNDSRNVQTSSSDLMILSDQILWTPQIVAVNVTAISFPVGTDTTRLTVWIVE